MSSFYGQLDLYKHSSTIDRKNLLTLNGGGFWARNFKSYSAHIDKTAFNVTRFIQPAFMYEMLNLVPDADGLNDRQLFDFTPERELLDELQVPMPPDTLDIFEVFLEIHENHKDSVVYTLEDEAYTEYRTTHDRLVNDKLKSTNEDVQGILSKARGYCSRIAMVIQSLEQALENIRQPLQSNRPQLWESRVSLKAVKAASAIIKQKLIMIGVDTDASTQPCLLSSKMCRLLSATWKTTDGTINPSEVSQKHLSERVG